MIPTVPVTLKLNDNEGNPIADADVTAKLSAPEIYQGYVVPIQVEGVTDAAGVLVLNLWPNALGALASTYAIKISPPDGKPIKLTATIPNAPCFLHDVANLPPFDAKPDGQVALDEAKAVLADVLNANGQAQAAEENASESAAAALASQQAAATSETNAASSRDIALSALPIESVNPPVNPLPGAEWIDSATGRRFSFIQGQWVETYASQITDNPTLVDALSAAFAAMSGTTMVNGTWYADVVASVAQLATASGASLLGYDTGSIQDVLDDAKAMFDYTALRAYTGRATSVRIKKQGLSGFFTRTGTAGDNGGTSIKDGLNRTWERVVSGPLNVLWFGADTSYATDSTTAIQNTINAAGWNGAHIYLPKGTYRIEGSLYIGTNASGANCYSVTMYGDSTHGTVLLRPKNTGNGPVLYVSGFHNVLETFNILSETNAAGTDYSASHGIMIRGNPQPGTNGNGTKENFFRNVKIMRCGLGMQLGNYNVDGKDPDIETNVFQGIEISQCNGGIFYNGQNILHNPLIGCHIVDCRDFLIKQVRGGDFSAERCYFGGMYDYLTNNYNVPATEKILISNGNVYMSRCRSEDWASTTGNATPRFALNVTSPDSKIIQLIGNTFTTRDNLSTEPCVNLSGQGTGGNASCKVSSEGNTYYGYVGINTIDFISIGDSLLGTDSNSLGVTNGLLRSANQKAQNFREVIFAANQDGQVGQLVIKTAGSNMIKHVRGAVAVTSEWQGDQFYTDDGMLWGRATGMRVTNATAGQESAVHTRGARNNGAYATLPETYGTAKPTAGTWQKNDRVVNSSGNAGEPDYWKCITAGTPGTWVANRKRGTFTLGATVATTVNDADVTSTSVILLMPTNAAAATLMGSAKALYLSARTAGVSFAFSTASGVAAAGTETFEYELFN